jgi:hypothetical protein
MTRGTVISGFSVSSAMLDVNMAIWLVHSLSWTINRQNFEGDTGEDHV